MTQEFLAKAKEIIQHTEVVTKNTLANRQEYNSKDLSWRNTELINAITQAQSLIIELLEILIPEKKTEDLNNFIDSENLSRIQDETIDEEKKVVKRTNGQRKR